MKRAVLVGAALLVATTAGALYLAVADGGDRRAAAFEEKQMIDCSQAKDTESCAKLNRLLLTLDGEVAALDEQLRAVEETLVSIDLNETFASDDEQLANVDLQNALQKQQQTLQMMSNISKMLFDTAQSVIRKMGG